MGYPPRSTPDLVISFCIAILLGPCVTASAVDRAPEVVDEAKAKVVWAQLVLATRDLDVLPDASFITGVSLNLDGGRLKGLW